MPIRDLVPRWLNRRASRPIGLLFLLLLLTIRFLDPAPLQALRIRLLDAYQILRPRVPDDRQQPVLIVDIDETSLAEVGQWPWQRAVMADLVDRVAAQGPAAVGFDILFPEMDGQAPRRLLERYPDLPPRTREDLAALPDPDARLAESLRGTRTVLGMAPQLGSDAARHAGFRHAPVRMVGGDLTSLLPEFDYVLRSIDTLDAAATGRASLTATPEADGIVRRLPSAVRIEDAVVPGLALEMLRVGLGAPTFTLEGDETGVLATSVGDYRVPTDPDGRVWVPHTRHQPWRFVSAADVLAGRVDPERFRGRLVLIGTTALGTVDLYATPVEPAMYGIEIQATLLEGILSDGVLRRPAWARWAELGAVAVVGGLIVLLMPSLSLGIVTSILAVLVGSVAGGAWYAFRAEGLLLDPVSPVVAALAVLGAMLACSLAEVDRTRRQLEENLRAQREVALRLEGELAAAREIQMGMLPPGAPSFPGVGLEVRAYLEPAREVGGDLYDFLLLDRSRLFFLVGDVSGKGLPAAMFMALTQALSRHEVRSGASSVGPLVSQLNDALCRENPAMMFVTLFAGLLDVESGALEYCIAGHEGAWVVRRSAPPRRLEGEGGPPLGAVEGFPYASDTDRLEAEECLLLVTDGVTEARSPSGELYSAPRVSKLLSALDDNGAGPVLRTLLGDVEGFVAGGEPADDLTILTLRRDGNARSPS